MKDNERQIENQRNKMSIEEAYELKTKQTSDHSVSPFENEEFAKDQEFAKINPNFNKGEIMANELHKNVNHEKNFTSKN